MPRAAGKATGRAGVYGPIDLLLLGISQIIRRASIFRFSRQVGASLVIFRLIRPDNTIGSPRNSGLRLRFRAIGDWGFVVWAHGVLRVLELWLWPPG